MTTKKPDQGKSPIDRFRDMARELGCDEDEAAFKAKLAIIARQKPVAPIKNKKKDADNQMDLKSFIEGSAARNADCGGWRLASSLLQ